MYACFKLTVYACIYIIMDRKEIFEWVREVYGVEPEYLWLDTPHHAVLRNPTSGKWFGIIMRVSGRVLGLRKTAEYEILNVKCDPLFIGSLLQQEGFLPAYHMNKSNWISILLSEGTVPSEQIKNLICISYNMTEKKQRAK